MKNFDLYIYFGFVALIGVGIIAALVNGCFF